MQIRVGYELVYDCPQPTPMILTLSIHYTRASDIVIPDVLTTNPFSMRIRRSASRSRTVTFASLGDAGVTYQLQYFLLVPAHDGLVELRGDKDSE